ncbi:hypothetical protein KIH39_10355 [Telmatocola sphagniphila]|uniref:Uncharacterized protein n=1 Tax=Telmatocola sphagniphila TaxID=1123043 RepID=A0A8E6F006_9BACT|nr:hypothetical protein [Telmatocola sphagniphila]QVL34283.1 hypothetical protein KIH39_10355 [Telmatocola sphagniphila]
MPGMDISQAFSICEETGSFAFEVEIVLEFPAVLNEPVFSESCIPSELAWGSWIVGWVSACSAGVLMAAARSDKGLDAASAGRNWLSLLRGGSDGLSSGKIHPSCTSYHNKSIATQKVKEK